MSSSHYNLGNKNVKNVFIVPRRIADKNREEVVNETVVERLIDQNLNRNSIENSTGPSSSSSKENSVSYDEGTNSTNVLKEKYDYKCQLCGKSYKQLTSLENHKCPSSEPNKVSCPSCNKKISKSNISHHLKIHAKKKFKCLKCKMSFNSEATLLKHSDTHKTVAVIECNICDKGFSCQSKLKKHMKSHSRQTEDSVFKLRQRSFYN